MPYDTKAKYAAWRRAYRRKRPEHVKSIEKAYRQRNHATVLARWRRIISCMSDYYVRRLLTGKSGKIRPEQWPEWLVRAKRTAVKLKRKHGLHQNNRRWPEQAD